MAWWSCWSLTRPWAQRKRQRGCASSGRLPPRTPWQNKRAPTSGNMRTGWPGRDVERCWPFQRFSFRTSSCHREEGTVWVTADLCWGKRRTISALRREAVYLSTSSRATMSPFFRALIANISPVLLYSANSTWREEAEQRDTSEEIHCSFHLFPNVLSNSYHFISHC